jgi:hypothetical protein
VSKVVNFSLGLQQRLVELQESRYSWSKGRSPVLSSIAPVNMAASRAHDRTELVRSVTSWHLSDRDLRQTLLSDFDKPLVTDASDAERHFDCCKSGFEIDVFTNLVKLGFRVIPQIKTGKCRIDMVVEGARDTRLAIKCDGDEFDGPDQRQYNMNGPDRIKAIGGNRQFPIIRIFRSGSCVGVK